jgi:hypothetical protein
MKPESIAVVLNQDVTHVVQRVTAAMEFKMARSFS